MVDPPVQSLHRSVHSVAYERCRHSPPLLGSFLSPLAGPLFMPSLLGGSESGAPLGISNIRRSPASAESDKAI